MTVKETNLPQKLNPQPDLSENPFLHGHQFNLIETVNKKDWERKAEKLPK